MITSSRRSGQSGSTLIVVVVLLALLAVMGLFAATVGVKELQTAGSEMRARIVRQVAEAGLSHAFEYARVAALIPTVAGEPVDVSMWEVCSSTDDSFPCGAAPASRRGNMYRYRGGYDFDGNGSINSTFERFLLDLPQIKGTSDSQAINSVGNFPVNYGVGAVLCTLDASRNCTLVDDDRVGLATVTLVSVAEIPGESARGTVVQTYGSFNVFSVPPSAPTLVSGGILQGVGNSTVVGNPNAGGPGVPVAIWSRGALDANNGSWQTCELDEYLRTGTSEYSETGVITCANCQCPADSIVSTGAGAGGQVGYDIQAPGDGSGSGTDYFTSDIKPSQYFPCDIFEFLFGVKARYNTDMNETKDKPDADDANADGIADAENGLPYGICEDGEDKNSDGRNDAMVSYLESIDAQESANCGSVNASSTGIFWIKGQCNLSGTIGSPDSPVVIIAEDGFKFTSSPTIYGVLVAIDPDNVDLVEANIANWTPEFAPGGGKARIYGSVIVEGGGKFNANIDLVASPKVIENINNSEDNRRFGVVPGSWTDQFSF